MRDFLECQIDVPGMTEGGITVTVCLISGRSEVIEVARSAPIDELKRQAQRKLEVRRGTLIRGHIILDGDKTVGAVNLQDGEVLTLKTSPPRLTSSQEGFGAILGDGTLVAWGKFARNDRLAVRGRLREITAGVSAFVGLLHNGNIVAWGRSECGGNLGKAKQGLPAKS